MRVRETLPRAANWHSSSIITTAVGCVGNVTHTSCVPRHGHGLVLLLVVTTTALWVFDPFVWEYCYSCIDHNWLFHVSTIDYNYKRYAAGRAEAEADRKRKPQTGGTH